MNSSSPPRPERWRDVTAHSLARLLARGLTPDQVGALYGRSGSLVRAAARTWGLDCRALRARSLGLAVTHPLVAAQFVCLVDGAPAGHGPSDLLSGSGARCLWRCPTCATEWVASVANRTRRGSDCPTCARRRGVEQARSRAAKSPPVFVADPSLAIEFVVNLSRPDRDAATTPSGSHDRVRWRCRHGHEWETAARQRVKHATQCPACLAGLWTSRLEYEVAELVGVATGATVLVGARVPRADRASDERVDLLVEDIGLLIDLDPSRWHATRESIERDTRKLQRLADRNYLRVRPRSLGLLDTRSEGCARQVVLATDDETDPSVWSSAVLGVLPELVPGVEIRARSAQEIATARARAHQRWRRLRAGPRRRSLLSEHPGLAVQFVRVVDRPGLTAADLAPAGDDRVVWRCPDCGDEWEARVANRTQLGTGCPPCAARRGAQRSAIPRRGRSFADLHPELVAFFIANETTPAKTLADLKPNSIDRCLWTCPHCAGPWHTTPHDLHRNPSRGCRACGYRRGVEKRRRRIDEDS